MNFRKLVIEQINKIFLKESKVQIKDESKRGFSKHLVVVWEKGLEDMDYNKAIGTIKTDGSILDVYMNNGDKITFVRQMNPAKGGIYVNDKLVKKINSQELFTNKATDLIKNTYMNSGLVTTNAETA